MMISTIRKRKLPLAIRIERDSIPVTECGCWLWLLKVNKKTGYGSIDVGKRTRLAHRVSYEAFRGPIPNGMLVCHQCDVRCCVNPDHLFLGTHNDNLIDMHTKGRNADLRGANNGNARFSEADIVDMRTSSLTTAALAQKYNSSFQTIWGIRAGVSWKHVKADAAWRIAPAVGAA